MTDDLRNGECYAWFDDSSTLDSNSKTIKLTDDLLILDVHTTILV